MNDTISRSVKVRYGIGVTIVVALLVAYSGWMAGKRRLPEVPASEFAAAVELQTLENLAVHSDGRIKSFASYANEMMNWVTGPRRYQSQAPAFTYLDLVFRPERYDDAAVVFVKHKGVREEVIDALEGTPLAMQDSPARLRDFDERIAWFRTSGLISPRLLSEPKVRARFAQLKGDVIRFEKHISQVESGLNVRSARLLGGRLNLVPPEGDDRLAPWGNIEQALEAANHPPHEGHEAHADDTERVAGVGQLYGDLSDAWRSADAERVNAVAAELSAALIELNPDLYPSTTKLEWESWYFRAKNLVWVWMIYLVSVVLLLLSTVYSWRWARNAGVGVFMLAFALQTFSVGLRWWVSGRWPNSNMFEAVTTSAWFGGVAAMILYIAGRKTIMKDLFLLCSGVASMVALMCAHFMPLQLNPNISNMMPVLHDVWLYVHTNVIIWSYILIFMAAVTAILYLVWRMSGGPRSIVPIGGMAMLGNEKVRGELLSTAPLALDPSGSLPMDAEPRGDDASTKDVALVSDHGAVLDGVTMILMKSSFVMLWAGLVMGAIWADHSWGRPWGWDPKETFALNTFLVFAVLVHVRFKVRDKALWTAILAVIGAGVTLFNWVVINFAISGLHSYA